MLLVVSTLASDKVVVADDTDPKYTPDPLMPVSCLPVLLLLTVLNRMDSIVLVPKELAQIDVAPNKRFEYFRPAVWLCIIQEE